MQDNVKNKYRRKARRNMFFNSLYRGLKRIKFLRNYLEEIKRRDFILTPTDEISNSANAARMFMKSILISTILFTVFIRNNGVSTYTVCMGIVLVIVINSEWIHIELRKSELRLLRQFEKYLGEMRYHFHDNGVVLEAIYDSLEDADYEISLHIHKIYEILEEEEETSFYQETAPNKYFVTFLALCRITMVYGDSFDKGSSLFLSNINSLCMEINIEILKRERLRHVFSGLIFLTIIPIFSLKVIEKWSTANIPELESYYKGTYGFWAVTIIFSLVLCSFICIQWLKKNDKMLRNSHRILSAILKCQIIDRWVSKLLYSRAEKMHRLDNILRRTGEGITIKQFLLKRYLLFICSFFIMCILWNHSQSIAGRNAIHYGDKISSAFLREEEKEKTEREIIEYSTAFKEDKITKELENDIKTSINGKQEIFIRKYADEITKEIIKRIKKYQKYQDNWYFYPVILLLAYLISQIPGLHLKLKKIFLNMSMEDEVMQFHSIISMLVPVQRMNVEIILEWMENFSEIFKPALVECVDNYSYDDEESLQKLKEREPFPPFTRIIENLEASDKIGISCAFEEIMAQSSFLNEKRKQDNEIIITNKGVIGKILAYIPISVTLAVYLIIPFITESVRQLMQYIEEFKYI